MGVEARTLQQKVFNSLGDVLAPGAVGIRGQTKTEQVSCECRVPQAEAGEGDIQDTGFLSYPRLGRGVTSVMAHGGVAESIAERVIPDGAADPGDEACGCGER